MNYQLKEQENNEQHPPTTNHNEGGENTVAAPERFGIDNPVFLSGEQVLLVLTPAEFVRIQSMLQGDRNASA